MNGRLERGVLIGSFAFSAKRYASNVPDSGETGTGDGNGNGRRERERETGTRTNVNGGTRTGTAEFDRVVHVPSEAVHVSRSRFGGDGNVNGEMETGTGT